MMLTKIDEEKVQNIDLAEYVACPKIIRPCQICGTIKTAAAVKRDDSNIAICTSCIKEVAKADMGKHRVNEPLIVGQDFCDLCGRKQAISTYKWGNKKVKTCSDCGTHFFNLLQNTPF